MACKNSPKECTNTTPFNLVYGHDGVFPLEIHLQLVRIQRQIEIPTEFYWSMMYDTFVDVEEHRLASLDEILRQKEQLVKAYNMRVNMKAFDLWEGLLKVIEVFSNNAYDIEELTIEGQTLCVNVKYLKKYKPMLQELKIEEK